MEVILCQDVQSVGKVGDVIKVKSGFARNYLIPQKLAYLATPSNLKKIESQKVQRAEQGRKVKQEAEELAEKLSKVSCTVAVEVNDLEKMYGSVTEPEIAHALQQEGHSIDKKFIVLEKPISELGIYDVSIKLHSEVTAKIRLWVTKK
ncbi:MAG: 50S ribosomal protein L9 [Omnitrophica WOR_2 bacterium RIFCSPHIGHO2_01_FULL_48_9]|nr:MAG: 50S ribosomal protein L9 [Omnitrophica WOR_2 bacterium RIFCSPHIGHO2_02_FULL_48_11]OGX33774.1 MAG: 50S ribosomal protein L9 [Omnitrophica WOR_2 bacterium RIFCSPHIGHO2_01_FULL_48_9]